MEKQTLINYIFDLCLRINDKTAHNTFIRFSGHVKGFEVEVYIGGWKSDAPPDFKWWIYTSSDIKEFEKIASKLETLINEDKIDQTEL